MGDSPDATITPARGGAEADRLSLQRAEGLAAIMADPAYPIRGVLEQWRDRTVIFRRCDEDTIMGGDVAGNTHGICRNAVLPFEIFNHDRKGVVGQGNTRHFPALHGKRLLGDIGGPAAEGAGPDGTGEYENLRNDRHGRSCLSIGEAPTESSWAGQPQCPPRR